MSSLHSSFYEDSNEFPPIDLYFDGTEDPQILKPAPIPGTLTAQKRGLHASTVTSTIMAPIQFKMCDHKEDIFDKVESWDPDTFGPVFPLDKTPGYQPLKDFKGSIPLSARIIVGDTHFPDEVSDRNRPLSFKVSVSAIGAMKRITIITNCYGSERHSIHEGRANFHLDGTTALSKIRDFSWTEEPEKRPGDEITTRGVPASAEEKVTRIVTMKFTSSGAQLDRMTVDAIDTQSETLRNNLRPSLQKFSDLIRGTSKKETRQFTIEVLLTSKWDSKKNNILRKALAKFESEVHGATGIGPFGDYRFRSGKPQIQSNAMIKREVIQQRQGHDFFSYPPFYVFPDEETAEVCIGFGVMCDRLFVGYINEAFTNMEHTCDVLLIENSKVLIIAIKLQQAKVLHDTMLMRVQEGQEFYLWIRDPNDDSKTFRIRGLAHADRRGLKGDFNFHVSVIASSTQDMKKCFGHFLKHQAWHLKEVQCRWRLKLSPVLSDAGYRRKIVTTHIICSPSEFPHVQPWQPSLLLQDPDKFPAQRLNSLTEGRVSNKIFGKWSVFVIQAGIRGHPMNRQQKDFLTHCDCFHGRINLLHGGVGTGKTEILARAGFLYLRCDVKVMFLGPTNHCVLDLLNHFLRTIKEIRELGDEHKKPTNIILARPSRLYQRHIQKAIVDKEHELIPDNNSVDAAFLNDVNSYYARHNVANDLGIDKDLLEEYTLAGQVAKRARDEASVLLGIYPPYNAKTQRLNHPQDELTDEADTPSSSENSKAVKKTVTSAIPPTPTTNNARTNDKKVDPYSLYVNGKVNLWAEIKRLMEKTGSLADVEKDMLQHALRKCGDVVVEEAHVMIGTSMSSTNRIYKKFGAGAPVVLIEDENNRDDESHGWMPIANMEHRDRIFGRIIAAGDLRLRPTVVSHNNSPPVNEFSGQLSTSFFERAMRAGVRPVTLQFQYRT